MGKLTEDELRQKLRMIISHASGGALSEPGDIDRSTNDICVEISRHKNEIWKQAQESAPMTVVTDDDRIADLLERCGERIGGGEPNTFTDEIYDTVDRLRAISAARKTVDRDASQVRDSSQQSSGMVERLVIAFDEIAPAWTSLADLEGYAKAALEASHHAELVEALSEAERVLTAILVDYGVDRHRARAEAATNVFRVLLAKIGGDA